MVGTFLHFCKLAVTTDLDMRARRNITYYSDELNVTHLAYRDIAAMEWDRLIIVYMFFGRVPDIFHAGTKLGCPSCWSLVPTIDLWILQMTPTLQLLKIFTIFMDQRPVIKKAKGTSGQNKHDIIAATRTLDAAALKLFNESRQEPFLSGRFSLTWLSSEIL